MTSMNPLLRKNSSHDPAFRSLLESQRELLTQLSSNATAGLSNQPASRMSNREKGGMNSKRKFGSTYSNRKNERVDDGNNASSGNMRNEDPSAKRRRKLIDLGNLDPSFFDEHCKQPRRDSLLSTLGASGHILSGLGGFSNHMGASFHSILPIGNSAHYPNIRLDGIALSSHLSFHMFDHSKPSVTETSDDDSDADDSSVDEFAGDDEDEMPSREAKTFDHEEAKNAFTTTISSGLDDPKDLKDIVEVFTEAMEKSQKSQQDIHDWDRKMGLKRSHSKTMRQSCRSRKKLKSMMRKQLSLLQCKKKN